MNPITYNIAVHYVSDLATSALPDAPVVPDPTQRRSRVRTTVAALLRTSTRRGRLEAYARRPLQAS